MSQKKVQKILMKISCAAYTVNCHYWHGELSRMLACIYKQRLAYSITPVIHFTFTYILNTDAGLTVLAVLQLLWNPAKKLINRIKRPGLWHINHRTTLHVDTEREYLSKIYRASFTIEIGDPRINDLSKVWEETDDPRFM